ncbi:DegT/DnrJ/EryC1/StrS family aminotransferase [Marinoscillum furvescens]|uniref:Pyridoxal phosphate-dependent aminotransferase EpsN n=1 Tax=Marinoscillum furvescens DSM 4134 TaxID=1122208 RepID=A0A3D9L1C6_MARFU|nr:aminotransferase class I/II-fold pyridoxal phosphate-dependent enzyme [Marinoscillum furvescens]RED97542.1 pyridoxal phosphate-dependent aminotransferase EpsN [Marinoscillum furvescens DSM 4134]
MSHKRIYFSAPWVSAEDIQAVVNTLENGWIAPVGPELNEFERQLQHQFGFPNVLALNSGTSALHLAVRLAGVQAGDEVVIGSFTFIAAGNAVLYEKARPVFIDSDEQSWNIDPELLGDYLAKAARKKSMPKAVIVTHIFGMPARMQELVEVCTRYGVALIEDAAEALGTSIGGLNAGAFGDYSILSFNGNKIITTSGGGALLCQSAKDHQKAASLATQSKVPADHFHHEEIGYNYRLSNVLAGLGLGQLKRWEEILGRKRAISERYRSELADISWLAPAPLLEGSTFNFWVNPFLIDPKKLSPSEMVKAFDAQNIEVRRFWKPLHMQPLFSGAPMLGGEVSKSLFEKGICLPSGAGLTHDEVSRVIEAIKKL